MDTRVIQLDELRSNPESLLKDCCDTGQAFVVQLPDRRCVTIQPVNDDDTLIDDLIASDAKFRALLASSASSPRKPLVTMPPTNKAQ